MKRLVFCFDGTWNKIDGENPTNVARIAQSVSRFDKSSIPQFIYYDEGVGTTATERLTGGMFGRGLTEKILEAYHILVLNYEPGDEIYVFGFSRGAFTARSFVGLLRNAGIMSRRSLQHIRQAVRLYVGRSADSSPNSERARQFRYKHCPKLCVPGDKEWRASAHPNDQAEGVIDLRIRYLGVWDTVGALGMPAHLKLLAGFNAAHQFHDTTLSSFVERARHAIAADERRRTFEPSVWTNLDDLNAAYGKDRPYEQLIFPGVHSAVGGGGPIRGLSDIALEWVFEGARKQGLAFDLDDQSPVFQLLPDHRAQLFNATGKKGWTWKDWATGVGLKDRKFPEFDRTAIHQSVARRYAESSDRLPERRPYRPPALKSWWDALGEMAKQARADALATVQALGGGSDVRALQAPARVRKYTVKPTDTLEGIAEREMGRAEDVGILKAHNLSVGLLFEDLKLYAGSSIEIPTYEQLTPAQTGLPESQLEQETNVHLRAVDRAVEAPADEGGPKLPRVPRQPPR
jgi:uncharacterized protein (DUF2235 family)